MVSSNREGIIKYDRSRRIESGPLPPMEYEVLERLRRRLYELGLIGVYPDGIGYGNISVRYDYSHLLHSSVPQFLITGSQTGHLRELTGEHYSRVLDYDIDGMKLLSMGRAEASSETLTHAAIYLANPKVVAVAHGHHARLWHKMIERQCPSTPEELAYGTASLARAVGEFARTRMEGILVMKGHADGIICFGTELEHVVPMLEAPIREFAE